VKTVSKYTLAVTSLDAADTIASNLTSVMAKTVVNSTVWIALMAKSTMWNLVMTVKQSFALIADILHVSIKIGEKLAENACPKGMFIFPFIRGRHTFSTPILSGAKSRQRTSCVCVGEELVR